MLWILVTAAAVAICYYIMFRPYKYWTEKGVTQGNPIFPFGDGWRNIFRKCSAAEMFDIFYNISGSKRYVGFYQFTIPALIIRDPELIKQITVKDFDHFTNHRTVFPDGIDPLWSKNLFALTGKAWREMRTTLSPAFTSSKMKYMFSLISQSGEQFVNHFLKKNEEIITIEMKDTFTRFTNDVIASTAFGIECDSLSDRNNEFYIMGKEVTNYFSGIWKTTKFFVCVLFPSLFKVLQARFFSEEVSNFFTQIVKNNIETREKHGIVRPDMINLLMEARKGCLKYEEMPEGQDAGFATAQEYEIGKNQKAVGKEITDEDITAQALVFFFAGFDAVSSLMCFMSYELGINPEIQDKLRQEVDETREACNGKLTYEALLGMKYMDMVVSESLRKWPSSIGVDRIATKPYIIEAKLQDEKPVHLKKGENIWLPIYSLHRDPKYFPDPERFDPERFSDVNKHKIKPYTYLPFGSGPRNCIGSRFALLEAKTLFFYILSHFKIVPVEKTKVPLVIAKISFNLSAEGGFWFGFKRRVK